jgi:hypothetical protein
MKRNARKLRLHRETLLSLNDPNLRVAMGAATAGTGCCSAILCSSHCDTCNQTDTCTVTNCGCT